MCEIQSEGMFIIFFPNTRPDPTQPEQRVNILQDRCLFKDFELLQVDNE